MAAAQDLYRKLVPRELRAAIGRRRNGKPLLPNAPVERQWLRHWSDLATEAYMSELGHDLDVVEISGRRHAAKPWRSFTSLEYPEFDLCEPGPVDHQFDLVVCEHVLEHVVSPWLACQTLLELACPGGHLIVNTPFVVRIHGSPSDYWRFTPDALRLLLERTGFEVLEVGSWGNRHAIASNLRRWSGTRPWRPTRNNPALPVVVWAFARRPARGQSPMEGATGYADNIVSQPLP